MLSVKSCFSPTLFRKNMSRFWPVWSLYGLVWFFMLVVGPLALHGGGWSRLDANRLPLDLLNGGVIVALIFGVLGAMAVFSYLYSNRSVGLLHALPLRRESLFLTNYLSGLAFFVLPNLGVALLSLAAQALVGAVHIGSLVLWVVIQSLLCFFFYSFAVFCAMFTGHLLALPAFYGILNGLVAGLTYLFTNLAARFLYGFEHVDGLNTLARWFTPVWQLGEAVGSRGIYSEAVAPARPEVLRYVPEGVHIVLFYAVVGLVLTALALILYRRRHLERAGDVVSVGWMRPVFKYGVGLCTAMAMGSFTYSLFGFYRTQTGGILLLFMLFWGTVGYFVAEMLLKKAFWIFKKSWKGCLVLLLCVAAGAAAMELDVTGFERRIPAEGTVERVSLGGVYSYPHDNMNYRSLEVETPEELALFRQLHQAVLAEKALCESYTTDSGGISSGTREVDGYYVEDLAMPSLRVTYFLKDGRIMSRYYAVVVTAERLADPNSAAALYTELINRTSIVERGYFVQWDESDRMVSGGVTSLETAEGRQDIEYLDSTYLVELLEAVRADIAAGRLGRRYLLEDAERMNNCYLSDLELTFVSSGAPRGSEGHQSEAVYYDDRSYSTKEYAMEEQSYSISIALQTTATETLAVLERAGVVNDSRRLITHAQSQQIDNAEMYGEVPNHTFTPGVAGPVPAGVYVD